ncbi:MAG: M28 family peptidase, partial [Solirubrobacterales bacterium]
MQAGIRRLHLLIDLRLYRLSFIPALLAVVIAMFSLEGVPDALQPVDPPTTFEGDRAAGVARQIASAAPDRTPGSAGDEAIADLVRSRFDEVPAGAVSEQTLEGTHDGEQVSLRNVLLTLPGEAGETIVVTAGRDSARGAGAATSAAATGILVELANALRVSHEKTYVLASTSGSSSGADGIRALIDNLPERDSIEAVIVISQPGAEDRRPPYVVATSDAETSPNAQLVRTAEGTVGIQAAASTPTEGAFTQLARLAVPSGI